MGSVELRGRVEARVMGVAIVATLVGAVMLLPGGTPRETFLLGGIQVNEADHGRWFDALRRAGLNTMSATVYARQGDWDSDTLWYEKEEEAVLLEIRGAKARGLHVVLIPRVALDHAFARNRFLWHGLIMPRTDAQLDSWFDRYRAFVVKWAVIAESEGVEVFAVGSELNTMASTEPVSALPDLEAYYLDPDKQIARKNDLMVHAGRIEARHLRTAGAEPFDDLGAFVDTETSALEAWARQTTGVGGEDALEEINRRRARLASLWAGLVREVRQVYGGRLTYAANFDQYRRVGFWPLLDAIGVNAYFPLRDLDAPTGGSDLYDALVKGWRGVLTELDEFRESRGVPAMPVIFTEIGYIARADATVAPWAGDGFTLVETDAGKRLFVWDEQPEDLRERALAVRALHEAHRDRGGDLLRGLLYWKLSTEPAHREIEPFGHILGADDDPLGDELRRFR